MEYENLYNLLNKVYPTCHIDWSGYKGVPNYPYIAVLDEPTNNMGADNKAFYKCENYSVELYASKSDYLEAESNLEKAFDENSIYWNKERIWLKDLKIFMTVYSI